MKYNIFMGALIGSLIIAACAVSFHAFNVAPHNWSAVIMWLPVYVFPIWGIAGASYLSERGKK
jgi:hypothetical protein